MDFGAEVYHQNDTMNGMKFIGQPEGVAPLFGVVRGGQAYPTGTRDILGELEPVNQLDLSSINMTASWQGERFGFKSITAYRETELYWQTDIDGTNMTIFNLTREEDARQTSQEFQLTYNHDRLKWLAGLFYFDERDSINARTGRLCDDTHIDARLSPVRRGEDRGVGHFCGGDLQPDRPLGGDAGCSLQ